MPIGAPFNEWRQDADTRVVLADHKSRQQAHAAKSPVPFAITNAIILTYAAFAIFHNAFAAFVGGICAGALSWCLGRPVGIFGRWTHDTSEDA